MGNRLVIHNHNKKYYSTIRLSHNQVKKLLFQNLRSVQSISIPILEEKEFTMSKTQIIDTLMTNLQRKELVELIHMFSIIRERNSEINHYLKYILIGTLEWKEC